MGADWLLCEAFCLYDDRERFKPYEKHHSTALDAGRLASKLNVKNLLLYHTEDKTLATRKSDIPLKHNRSLLAASMFPMIWKRLFCEIRAFS